MSIEIKENALQEKTRLEEILQKKIEDKNYLSAIKLAQTLKLPQEKIRNLQDLALKQMAFEYRNAVAVRNLAREWEISKTELESLIKAGLEEKEGISEKKCLEQAYDIVTGKYLTLRQWVDQFLNSRSE
jgi:hypothetical protein